MATGQRRRVFDDLFLQFCKGRGLGAALRQPFLLQVGNYALGIGAVVVDARVGLPELERGALIHGPDFAHGRCS
ncbi:MAG: hypothetical protein F4119_02565 [Acidimicrobiia bacterium]|nr:hypothetical protein [Acidimicrobiia bacterium]